ncbi:hypothetical protein [Nannocystis punicea]|uniref:VWFA domain-containing protein n=1 Tax=Nannocystis punicea TaxID=2995304 RepID=A0ABY7HAR9_9BACT|nr:hypothetical protein [Nannocystis poenicansa]WAS96316.1 hypothetical protein O0S08_09155 [Nannocystis poenicansa]
MVSFASVVFLSLFACGPKGPGMATDTADTGSGTSGGGTVDAPTTSGGPGGTSGGTAGMTMTGGGGADLGAPETTTGGTPTCEVTGGCNRLDLLFVIDNSGGMADEQKHLVAAVPHLVARLRELVGEDGLPVEPDVHVMVTTTDMGHPMCEPFEKPDYDAAMGAPIASPCALRLDRFTGLGANPLQRPDVCLEPCPERQLAVPVDPFVAFDAEGHNVVASGEGDPVVEALECLLPQGIDGCGFESPLESMMQALDPAAEWNAGAQPFLRPGAALAIVLVGDETDCSALDLRHFDPKNVDDPVFNQFWEDSPGVPGVKDEPTSAICWNASMTCEDTDPDLAYDSCVPEEKGVLQPLSRYTGLLVDVLGGEQDKPVFMLVVTGIPTTGIEDLVHRGWAPEDILPDDSDTPAQKEFDYGIGPGCTSPAAGNGLPPGRIRQLCEALDVADDPDTPADESQVRCCFESTCNTDLSGGFDCLADKLAHSLRAAG